MAVRKIVEIDHDKCDGCGLCIPECPEGAIEIIDGKAQLVSEIYCDGLGACLGHCPVDAITVIEREAEDFDEQAVEQKMHDNEKKQSAEPHQHHQAHQCPSSTPITIEKKEEALGQRSVASQLTNWPIQITLAPPKAPYFDEAELLIAADCVPFAYAGFHRLLKGKVLLIGCPKLDEADFYAQKLAGIIRENNIKSVTVAHMEVPCCFGLKALTRKAIETSGKNLLLKTQVFGVKGEQVS